MKMNRRNFFQTLGITGLTLTLGKQAKASVNKKSTVDFKGILIDATKCVGCQSCEMSCAEVNNLPEPADSPEAGKTRNLSEFQRCVVNCYETSKGEVYVKKQCMHCGQPACDAACLTQAMNKTEEGPVTWQGNKCMGCRYCMVSCPFDIPKFEYHSANPKIQKCDMCFEKISQGELPACVENCPAEAIVYGTRRELLNEARKRIVENPDTYYNHIYGENEAGGTCVLYLSPVPFEELGFKTNLQNSSYPELSKGFLYSVPTIFVLWPALLLGLREATKDKPVKTIENE